jgi:phospholipase/lecithinase/hemolysin
VRAGASDIAENIAGDIAGAVAMEIAKGQLVVFGDSLSDVGNAWLLLGDGAVPSPPHWRGRRCNGPLWVELLSERLGLLPLAPSRAGGTDHAFGGARSGGGLSPKGVPNLLEQVALFLNCRAATPLEQATLVVLRAGANDYLDGEPGLERAEAINANLVTAVTALAQVGARRFLVPTELPWGVSPIVPPTYGPAQRQAFDALIGQQNKGLARALQDLAQQRGLQVWQPDFHGLLQAAVANPRAFDLVEVVRPVLQEDQAASSAQGVPDATGFLWWDSRAHFCSAFHQRLAELALACLAADPIAGPTAGPTAELIAAGAGPDGP